MVTLTAILPCNPNDNDFEAFMDECSRRWIASSAELDIRSDLRERLEIYSNPVGREYSVEELDDIAKTMKFIPQTAITIESGREEGANEMALWFAKLIVEFWGGFIDGHGEIFFEHGWTRKDEMF